MILKTSQADRLWWFKEITYDFHLDNIRKGNYKRKKMVVGWISKLGWSKAKSLVVERSQAESFIWTFGGALSLMVNPRAWLAEAIATYALVFFGPLSVILAAAAFGDGLSIEGILLISFSHGAAIGLMVYAFGHVSGAHINPAVTIPMIITKKIGDCRWSRIHHGSQIIGGIVAALYTCGNTCQNLVQK